MLQSIKTIKFSVKDIVVPLWKGAKGKFWGAMPPSILPMLGRKQHYLSTHF